jgi:hypothetical protein
MLTLLLMGYGGAAWCAGDDMTYIVHGRAGVPVGFDRQAYLAETARPPNFDAQLQFKEGNGRSGGPAALAHDSARSDPAAVRRAAASGGQQLAVTYGRAGYVPDLSR